MDFSTNPWFLIESQTSNGAAKVLNKSQSKKVKKKYFFWLTFNFFIRI
jgi:hypothetical protein